MTKNIHDKLARLALCRDWVAAGGDPEEWDAFADAMENASPRERWIALGLSPEAFDQLQRTEGEIEIEIHVTEEPPPDPGPPPNDDATMEEVVNWFKKKVNYDIHLAVFK